MTELIDKIKKELMPILVAGAIGISGCSKDHNQNTDYLRPYTHLPNIGNAVMYDDNEDGKIDIITIFLKDKKVAILLDTNVVTAKDRMFYFKDSKVMDNKTIELATEINRLERELSFRIDSLGYNKETKK